VTSSPRVLGLDAAAPAAFIVLLAPRPSVASFPGTGEAYAAVARGGLESGGQASAGEAVEETVEQPQVHAAHEFSMGGRRGKVCGVVVI
jgi:hypothetical protein